MVSAIKLPEDIILEAKINSRAFSRSVSGQIEYWARIGKIAEENPDLTYDLIKQILIAKSELELGRLFKYDTD